MSRRNKGKKRNLATSVQGEAAPVVLPPFGLAEDVLPPAVPAEEKEENMEHALSARPAEPGGRVADDDIVMKFVTFFLDKEEYALPITEVQEINRVNEITRVPQSAEHVMGVINLRGRIVPVIELKHRLNLGASEIDKASRIVVVEHGPKVVGLLVDQVAQVLNLSPEQVEEPPEEVVKAGDNCVKGVGKVDDRMVILLELGRILDREKAA